MEQVIKISTSEHGTNIIAKRMLVSSNDPVLKEKLPEFNFLNPKIHPVSVANALIDVLKENNALGLSANQIGMRERVFVMGQGNQIVAFFNPRILEASKETDFLQEGCLSFPNLFIKIRRSKQIHVAYQDYNGKHHEEKFSGLTARIFQHEYSHAEGRTYFDDASKISIKMGIKEAKKQGYYYSMNGKLLFKDNKIM